jgi:hypothetical protein
MIEALLLPMYREHCHVYHETSIVSGFRGSEGEINGRRDDPISYVVNRPAGGTGKKECFRMVRCSIHLRVSCSQKESLCLVSSHSLVEGLFVEYGN